MNKLSVSSTLLFFMLLSISACNQTDSHALAQVGDEVVTEEELNRELQRFLGSRADKASSDVRRTVLESMVQKRAIVSVAEKELDDAATRDLEEQIKRYRDNELIKLYMRNHTQPRPVTDEMVEAYYKAHTEQFGAANIKQYLMLVANKGGDKARETAMLEMLQNFQTGKNWSTLVDEARKKGIAVSLKSGRADENMLHEQLRKAMSGLTIGETSDPVTIGHNVYLVRITGESSLSPKALEEVRPEIRKLLAAEILKQNIKQASELAVGQVKVEYMGMGGGS